MGMQETMLGKREVVKRRRNKLRSEAFIGKAR